MLPSLMLGESTTEGIMGRGQLAPGFWRIMLTEAVNWVIFTSPMYTQNVFEKAVSSLSLSVCRMPYAARNATETTDPGNIATDLQRHTHWIFQKFLSQRAPSW